jgi:hypothetical protein
MTARPIFYDNWRRTLGSAVALCIVLLAMLLAAGCSEPAAENRTVNATPPLIIPQPATTEIPTSVNPNKPLCSQQGKDPNSVVSGEPFFYQSHVPNPNASTIRVWIFGPNTAIIPGSDSDSLDRSNLTLSGEVTQGLKNGIYQVLFQYPDESGQFDVAIKNSQFPHWILNKNGDLVLDIEKVRNGGMKGIDAADILEKAINSDESNQKAERTTINITEAWIIINPVQDAKRGTSFTINGTTNLPNRATKPILKIVIWPTELDPRRSMREQSVEDYGSVFSSVVDIDVSDNCVNTFLQEIPGRDVKPGEYFVSVTSIDLKNGYPGEVKNNSVFNIV